MALSRHLRLPATPALLLVLMLALALVAPLHLPAAAAPLPDLRVTVMDVRTTSVSAGAALGVETTVKNVGRKKAARSLLRWYLSRDDAWSKGDIVLGKRRVPGLAPGKVHRKAVDLVVPASTAARRYFVVACADAKDAVKESREGNNCSATPRKVEVTTPEGTTFPLEPDPLSVDSTLQTDRAVSTTAIAAPVDDFSTVLTATAADGTKYTLEVPYRALLTSEKITMTPVASVPGLPLSGGLVAGVQIEPHGLMLQEPATLTIESPDAGSLESQTGFIFDGNGDDFHLYPLASPEAGDDKDVIRMALTHFSTPGVGAATSADRANVRNHPPVNSQAQLEQEVSELLRGERQNQLNGEPPDPSVTEQVVAVANSYFDDVLRARMQAAEGNADIGPQTIAEALSWVRQMLLLGVEDNRRIREAMNRIEKIAENMMNTYWTRCATEHDLAAAVGLVGLARQAALIGWGWQAEAADKAERCANFEVRFSSLITYQSGHSGEMSVGQTEGRWGVESTAEIPWTGFGDGALTYTAFEYTQWLDYPWDDCGHYSDTVGTATAPGRLTGLVGVRANPWDPPVGRPLPPVLYVRIDPGMAYEDYSFREAWPTETYHTDICGGESYDETRSDWQSQFESLHPGIVEWELTAVKNEVLLTESWDRSIPHDGGSTTEKTTVELWHKPLP